MLSALSNRGRTKTGLILGLVTILLLTILSLLYLLEIIRKNGTTPLTGGSTLPTASEVSTAPQPSITPAQALNLKNWPAGLTTRLPAATSWKSSPRRQLQSTATKLSPTKTPDPIQLSPGFQSFISRVKDGTADLVRGVYVEGVINLPVLQQPENDIAFVSLEDGTATQFRSAAAGGVIGLLAHNFLSGAMFYNLRVGEDVQLVYGDGRFRSYRIEGVYQYQKLSPNNLQSDLVELSSGKTVSTNEVFARFYRGGDHVTFQTCLEKDGLSNWGLTFWIAMPLQTLQ